MSIAQLYQHIQTIGLHIYEHMAHEEKVKLIQETLSVPRGDVTDYMECLTQFPAELLLQADHQWAFELNMIQTCQMAPTIEAYVYVGLLGDYERSLPKQLLRQVFAHMPSDFSEFWDKPLGETLTILAERIQTANRLREERFRELRTMNPMFVARMLGVVATLGRELSERSHADGLTMGAKFCSEFLATLGVPSPSDPEPEPPKDYSDEVNEFCATNQLFAVTLYRPGKSPDTIPFSDSRKIRRIRKTLKQVKLTTGQVACGSCEEFEGSFSCGADGCHCRMCGSCFLEWHLGHKQCPECHTG